MEVKLFGRTFNFGVSRIPTNGHKVRETATTIVTVPNFTPRESLPKVNVENLRAFSRSAIPHRAITLIRNGVLAQNWRIVPRNKGDKRSYKTAIKVLENIINKPNETDTYRTFWGQIINETLIGDNGAAEIVVTNHQSQPIKLYPVNGFALEHVTGYFTNPDYPRFAQVISGYNKVYLNDKDIIYIQNNKTTDTPFGLSPLESAFRQINALLDTESYAQRQTNNSVPKNALYLGEGVLEPELDKFRKYWREDVQGRGEMAILGGPKGAAALKIGAEGDEGLFLQWQGHLITLISLAFSIDPKKLGQGSNTDRSTVEEQNESMLSEAIRPYCLLIADEINKKILGRLGLDGVLKFEFVFEDTLTQKQQKQTMLTEQWNNNGITLYEYRNALGLPVLDSEYENMTQAEMKSALNKKYAVQTGGFNGLGKDQKSDMVKKLDGQKDSKQSKN